MVAIGVASLFAFSLLVLQLYGLEGADVPAFLGHPLVEDSLGFIALIVVSFVALFQLWLPHPVRSIRGFRTLMIAMLLVTSGNLIAPFALSEVNMESINLEFSANTIGSMIGFLACLYFYRWAEIEYNIRYHAYYSNS